MLLKLIVLILVKRKGVSEKRIIIALARLVSTLLRPTILLRVAAIVASPPSCLVTVHSNIGL